MTGRRDWLAMTPAEFDTAAVDVPEGLFDLDVEQVAAGDDGCGTGDLFDAQEN